MTTIDYFERKLDEKRRLTIPAELRHEFAGREVVLTRGFKNYLHLYTQETWEQKVEPRLKGDVLSEEVADLNVQFRLGKVTAQMDDKQGRVTIEQHLLDYAGIDKSVIAVRVGDYWRLMPGS
ncbi:hypothetical protein DYH10_04095 [Candidatus Saccharibacteria bacterium CPR2]|nr:hypothetical protein [Candidatus Saccharibacteria bacterium CPR2]